MTGRRLVVQGRTEGEPNDQGSRRKGEKRSSELPGGRGGLPFAVMSRGGGRSPEKGAVTECPLVFISVNKAERREEEVQHGRWDGPGGKLEKSNSKADPPRGREAELGTKHGGLRDTQNRRGTRGTGASPQGKSSGRTTDWLLVDVQKKVNRGGTYRKQTSTRFKEKSKK